MYPNELAGAGVVLLLTVGAGTVAHELTHAIVLRAFGVTYDIEWAPDRTTHRTFGAGLSGRWAAVTPRAIPEGLPPWVIRAASVAPFVLVAPLLPVVAGVAPDPLTTGSVYPTAVTVGWLACSIPSPQDFSLFWHAHRVIDGDVQPDTLRQGTQRDA